MSAAAARVAEPLDDLTVRRAQRGDEAAWRALIARFERPVHALIWRLLAGRARHRVESHGGANTTAEALYHGVPLVVIPLIAEQPLQAHLVARSGAGLHLDAAAVTPEAMHDALRRVTHEPSFRRTAETIRASFRERDGARGLAEAAIALAGQPAAQRSAPSAKLRA